MSDGKFEVRPFAAGEIVPELQVADAVQNGTVEAGQTAAYYYFGKHANFVFETGLPFSVNQRQLYAWLQFGGGSQLINDFYKEYNFRSFVFGGTGCQMGGWFRKEIKSMDDMKGLKFRVGGFAGLILERLGVVPQQIAGGDIYPALEKGTIDACEWVGPYDDEKLGFNKVAKYYYYPGWWEGCSGGSLYINNDAWAKLPKNYQAWSRLLPASSPPGWCRSTTPATLRRCAAWWRRAPSCGRSRAPCSSPASTRPTSSTTSSRQRIRSSRRSTTA